MPRPSAPAAARTDSTHAGSYTTARRVRATSARNVCLQLFDARVVVGMVPVETHHDRDLRGKTVDRAVALVDLGHDPVARADPAGRHGRHR